MGRGKHMTEPVSAVARAAGLENSSKNNYQVRNHNSSRNNGQGTAQESQRQSVDRAVQALEEYVHSHERSLDISVHQTTGDITVKVISDQTGEVIREVSYKGMLDNATRADDPTGLLFDKTI
jgi:flagellar protein FlaG